MKKFLQTMLLVIAAFFVTIDVVDAAPQVLEKSGTVFGSPTIVSGNQVYISLASGRVKFVRHTKYLDSSQTKQAAYQQVRGNRSGFAYRCGGYYMTRVYSDLDGKNLIGTIRVYVAASDLPNATTCEAITPPPNNAPAAKPPKQNVPSVNVSHPNPLAVESKNTIKVDKIEELGGWTDAEIEAYFNKIWGQIGDVGEPEYVDPMPEFVPDELPPFLYNFEEAGYDPLMNFDEFYTTPTLGGWNINNFDLNNSNTLPFDFSVGDVDGGEYERSVAVNRDLEGDACLAADANIYYYEHYYDDAKDADEDNTLCIGRAEYNNCDLVRYFAKHRDGWNEEDDHNFANVSQELKNILNFPAIYCKFMTNYIEADSVYDPISGENLVRSDYQITECTDDSSACDEMIPDPYYTPFSPPDGGTDPDIPQDGGGSPRRSTELFL